MQDGVVFIKCLRMIIFHGELLLRRYSDIIDRVVAAGLHNSLRMRSLKLGSWKIAIVQPLDRYYSFKLYHMQPAYLILVGCFLSTLCFMVVLFLICLLKKRD